MKEAPRKIPAVFWKLSIIERAPLLNSKSLEIAFF